MNIGLTFKYTFTYLRLFYLRRDLFLLLFSASAAVYTATYIGAFLLLFAGIRALVADEQTLDVSVKYLSEISPGVAIYIGVVCLGLSLVFYLYTLLAGIRAGANFGTDVLYKFAPVWDELNPQKRKNIVAVATFASRISRPVLNSLVPVATFFAGVGYLAFINPWMAPLSIILGGAALFAFIPANIADEKLSRNDFSPDIDEATLTDARPQVRAYMGRTFRAFRARRIISFVNLLILFFAILAVLIFLGPDRLVAALNEQAVILVIVARTSVMSLKRLTLCLRIVSNNIATMDQIFAAVLHGIVPRKVTVDDEGDEEE